MLKKRQRLSHSEFEHYFKTGTKFHSKEITIIHSPHDRLHAAVVVGKKVSKLAVTRNRLRRQVYDVVRQTVGDARGVYIVLVKPPLASLPRKERLELLKELIGRAVKKTYNSSHV